MIIITKMMSSVSIEQKEKKMKIMVYHKIAQKKT